MKACVIRITRHKQNTELSPVEPVTPVEPVPPAYSTERLRHEQSARICKVSATVTCLGHGLSHKEGHFFHAACNSCHKVCGTSMISMSGGVELRACLWNLYCRCCLCHLHRYGNLSSSSYDGRPLCNTMSTCFQESAPLPSVKACQGHCLVRSLDGLSMNLACEAGRSGESSGTCKGRSVSRVHAWWDDTPTIASV